jgi:hypothetical protein
MIRILVDYDLIGIPQPAAAQLKIGRRDAEIEAVEPETVWTASAQVKDVAFANSPSESSVLEWLIQMVAGIGSASIVTGCPGASGTARFSCARAETVITDNTANVPISLFIVSPPIR